MGVFTVKGGRSLCGTVNISGAKNAALPILFATMLTEGESVIENCPQIADVDRALSILAAFGAKTERTGTSVRIQTENLTEAVPDDADIRSIRASSYLIGACLARFGKVRLRSYGGCAFADRPIDMHIGAVRALGGEERDDLLTLPKKRGGRILFPKSSVGATVNALLLTAAAEGNTEILGAAKEPHVDSLIAFLNSAGADIRRNGDSVFVKGTGSLLHAGNARIIPDAIEAGTYLLLGPLTGGNVGIRLSESERSVSGFAPIQSEYERIGIKLTEENGILYAQGHPKADILLTASPYPGFPTDLQPLLAVLLSKHGGRIRDAVFPERFGYLRELLKFGIFSFAKSEGTAEILPSVIHSGIAEAKDLRGGMACLLAGLCAEGESRISSGEKILRGYEDPILKLSTLGAAVGYEEG